MLSLTLSEWRVARSSLFFDWSGPLEGGSNFENARGRSKPPHNEMRVVWATLRDTWRFLRVAHSSPLLA